MWLCATEIQDFRADTGDVLPRRFRWEGDWIEVWEVLDRWYQTEPLPEWPLANCFKVASSDGHHYLLKHDREAEVWFVARRW